MSEIREQILREIEQLKKLREELKDRLAQARKSKAAEDVKRELKETLSKLEEKLPGLEASAREIEEASSAALEQLGETARNVLEEIKRGYKSYRDRR